MEPRGVVPWCIPVEPGETCITSTSGWQLFGTDKELSDLLDFSAMFSPPVGTKKGPAAGHSAAHYASVQEERSSTRAWTSSNKTKELVEGAQCMASHNLTAYSRLAVAKSERGFSYSRVDNPHCHQSTQGDQLPLSPTKMHPYQALSPTKTHPYQTLSPTKTHPYQALSPTKTHPYQALSPTATHPYQTLSPTTTHPLYKSSTLHAPHGRRRAMLMQHIDSHAKRVRKVPPGLPSSVYAPSASSADYNRDSPGYPNSKPTSSGFPGSFFMPDGHHSSDPWNSSSSSSTMSQHGGYHGNMLGGSTSGHNPSQTSSYCGIHPHDRLSYQPQSSADLSSSLPL
ncbi:hypothetical protein WMY93_021358 [Mugilogobius chulae]|uniref:Uncharacterized protein n=1 Tax=Mugilogobius chulae TaxID=88201 RepID=A0AAW0NAI0_9GOBI